MLITNAGITWVTALSRTSLPPLDKNLRFQPHIRHQTLLLTYSKIAFLFRPTIVRAPRCKVFIKWASLIEINWIKFGLIK